MKTKVIRLTELDVERMVKKIIKEGSIEKARQIYRELDEKLGDSYIDDEIFDLYHSGTYDLPEESYEMSREFTVTLIDMLTENPKYFDDPFTELELNFTREELIDNFEELVDLFGYYIELHYNPRNN